MSLEVSNLVGGYSQVPVLKDVSFDVKDGELVGLIGLNGAGKSTTINHIIGLLTPFKDPLKLTAPRLTRMSKSIKNKLLIFRNSQSSIKS